MAIQDMPLENQEASCNADGEATEHDTAAQEAEYTEINEEEE